MPFYMHQWSYKDQQVRKMITEETDRAEVVRIAIKAFGGTLHAFFYSFGEYDGMAISEFPDGTSAFAAVLSITGQGRISAARTTALFSPEEGLQAMHQAHAVIKDS